MEHFRLEKIANKAVRTTLINRPPAFSKSGKPLVTIPEEDFEWLIEQAERAQELEGRNQNE